MDYSIVMPVFNREDLTRNCLDALPKTLEGAGAGEVIVVDNGSRPATAEVLRAFPWVRVIRNETNLGFAAACNQGARAAVGRYIIHLNNDTVALDGWLARLLERFREDNVGIVGARLLFPNDKIQHAGVMFSPARLGPEGFGPYHFLWGNAGTIDSAQHRRDFEAVTGACMATPRELFLELGGFDETFWNGYEDVDYCLKVRARGLRVTYEPTSVLYHFESQSGVQRKRRLMHNVRELADRWALTVVPDSNRTADLSQQVRREQFIHRQRSMFLVSLPPTTVIVHGDEAADAGALVARIRGGKIQPEEVIWAAAGEPPRGTTAPAHAGSSAIVAATEVRSDRYVAFVDTRAELEADWLLELVDTVEFARDIAAATVLAPAEEDGWAPLSADAQCTLVKMGAIPQHLRVDPAFPTVSGAVADWLARVVGIGRSVRRTHRVTARVSLAPADPVFEERYGASISAVVRPDPLRMEEASRRPAPQATFASIVMLSWNAPEFTELAVESIRKHTGTPHEIIIIDNGSGPETVARIKAITGVQTIYNSKNMGFAHGCNQGLAAARGTHVVLLNNDVIVTDGWLEALLEAHRTDPAVGVSAPRSNYVAGHQLLHDTAYDDMNEMHAYARRRSERWRGRMYHADRVIGFCMCISRAVIDEVGGIDTRYGVGNFEDDDFCVRVRAAGYEIVVCEDSFVHHFGSVSFRANNVDYGEQMQTNWAVFAERWNLPRAYPANGYDPRAAILRGFVRARDYVPLPQIVAETPVLTELDPCAQEPRRYALAILAVVRDESDWSRVAPVVASYARALGQADSVVLAIAAAGSLDALTLGGRVERTLAKAGLDPKEIPDIDIEDVDDTPAWRDRFIDARCLALTSGPQLENIEALADRSRSGLARLVRTLVAS